MNVGKIRVIKNDDGRIYACVVNVYGIPISDNQDVTSDVIQSIIEKVGINKSCEFIATKRNPIEIRIRELEE